jgi:hypothetical protein
MLVGRGSLRNWSHARGRILLPLTATVNRRACKPSNSHFAERGCVGLTSRSGWLRGIPWEHANLLRLVGTTQPRSGAK